MPCFSIMCSVDGGAWLRVMFHAAIEFSLASCFIGALVVADIGALMVVFLFWCSRLIGILFLSAGVLCLV